MKEWIKKSLLVGLGAMALSEPKVKKMVKDAEKSGNLTRKQAERVLKSLTRASQQHKSKIKQTTKKEMQEWENKLKGVAKELEREGKKEVKRILKELEKNVR